MIGHSTPCRTPITQRPTHLARALMMAVPVMLAACGGGSGSDAPSTGIAAPAGFTVGYGTKGYTFQWSASVGASRYELFEDPDGPAGPQPEVIVGGANDHTITAFFHQIKSAQLHERVNATYRLRACDGTGCGAFTAAITPDVTQAIGYFKASNGEAIDAFGSAVALSADGRVMAVSATGERSNATCPTTSSCDQADNSIANAGAVYVFSRNNSYGLWTLASYLKAGNNRAYDNGRYLDNGPRFGASLALSADGSTLVVGAPGETSSAKGVNGDASDTQTQGAGAAYVFKAIGSSLPHGLSMKWVQEAYLKASNTRPKADYSVDIMGYYVRDPQSFGSSVAVSSDGNLVAVGAPGEGSKATGINGDQSDHSAIRAGAVYTYSRSSSGAGGAAPGPIRPTSKPATPTAQVGNTLANPLRSRVMGARWQWGLRRRAAAPPASMATSRTNQPAAPVRSTSSPRTTKAGASRPMSRHRILPLTTDSASSSHFRQMAIPWP